MSIFWEMPSGVFPYSSLVGSTVVLLVIMHFVLLSAGPPLGLHHGRYGSEEQLRPRSEANRRSLVTCHTPA